MIGRRKKRGNIASPNMWRILEFRRQTAIFLLLRRKALKQKPGKSRKNYFSKNMEMRKNSWYSQASNRFENFLIFNFIKIWNFVFSQQFDTGKMPKLTDKTIRKTEITSLAKKTINGVQSLTPRRGLLRTGKNEKRLTSVIKCATNVLGNCMMAILLLSIIMTNMFLTSSVNRVIDTETTS